MKKESKTKKQLESDLDEMRQRLSELEKNNTSQQQLIDVNREGENNFRIFAENARDMLYRMSLPDGAYEYVSPASLEIFGYTPSEFYDSPILIKKSIHPDWNDFFEDAWNKLLIGEITPTYEYQIIHKSGEIRWLNQRNTLVTDSEGKPIALEGIVTDITEAKRLQDTLIDSQEKFNLIGENTADFISIVGLDGKYIYASPSYKLLGYDPDKLIGKDGFKIIHPEDKKQLLPLIKQVVIGLFKPGEKKRFEIRISDKKGKYHDTESIVRFMRNEAGELQILSVIRDITERKQIENEILQSRNQIESIFKASPAGIGVVEERKFKFVNDRFAKMLGYTKEELVGNLSRMIYTNDAEFERVGKYKYEQIKEKGVGTVETVFKKMDGSLIDVLLSSAPINTEDLSEGVTFTAYDITESKQIEDELEKSDEKYRLVRENTSDLISIVGLDGKFVYVSPSYKVIGYNPEELIGVDGLTFLHPKDKRHLFPIYKQVVSGFFKNNVEKRFEFRFLDGAGNYRDAESLVKLIKDDSGKRQILSVTRDVTERKLTEEKLKESEKKYRILFNSLPYGAEVMDTDGNIKDCSESNIELLGYKRKDIIGKHITKFLHPDSIETFRLLFPKILQGELAQAEIQMICKDGECIDIIRSAVPIFDDQGNVVQILATNTNITKRKQAEKSLVDSIAKFRLLANHTHDWEYWIDPEGNYTYISPSCERITGYSSEELTSDPEKWFEMIRPDHFEKIQKHYKKEINKSIPMTKIEFPIITRNGEERWLAHTCSPIFNEEGDFIGRRGNNRDITERVQAEEMINRQHQFTSALHEIDKAITTNQDLDLTLNILINHTHAQLEADAVAIFLLDRNLHMLSYEVGTGFTSEKTIQTGEVKLGESFCGQVALERKLLVLDFENEDVSSEYSEFVRDEKFISYAGVPLIVKGQVLGVLEIYQRTPLDPDREWISTLETLAGQAAIAIDNISLFNDLQQANLELGLGYEQTIEGWAKTLEMRDNETEGHSQRVTEMTVKLAQQMGISSDEVVHIRRGALLHDIGKMNIPDSIIQKNSELNDAEWEIMKKHTEIAYQFLSPIKFLEPALDIPQYHHEKWDGTGYPHGLKGKEIPIAARIFSVVDVWDALSWDRPYRKAWSKRKVLKYIKKQSGVYFDPQVVVLFLELIEEAHNKK